MDRDERPPAAAGVGPAGPRRRRRRWPYVVALVALLSAAAGALGWWYGSGRYTATPGLQGLSYTRALARARSAGVRVRQGPAVYSDTIPAGEIVAQRPHSGTRVVDGGWVTVSLSRGVLRRAVPAVAGSSVAAARSRLAGATLRVSRVDRSYSSSRPSGEVLRTLPAEGTVLRHGSAVVLVVSAGPRPVSVPSVTDLTPTDAAQRLNAARLRFRDGGAVYSTTVPAGQVIGETPGAGQQVRPGTVVTVTVSKGPQMIAVPRLTGRRVAAAEGLLRAAGLVPKVESFPGGPGIVVAQTPDGGTLRPQGSTVILIVF